MLRGEAGLERPLPAGRAPLTGAAPPEGGEAPGKGRPPAKGAESPGRKPEAERDLDLPEGPASPGDRTRSAGLPPPAGGERPTDRAPPPGEAEPPWSDEENPGGGAMALLDLGLPWEVERDCVPPGGGARP